MASNIIWPDDLMTLSEEDQVAMLTSMHERRAKIGNYIKNAKRVADKLSVGTLKTHIEKEITKFTKAAEKADKAIAEMEKRISTITALRIQLEDADGPK